MSDLLKGKTALVTGSTSGIGLGIAQALAAEGANIILNGFGDSAPATAAIEQFGVSVGYHPADLRDAEQITEMMAFAANEAGSVDILVNNAGIQHVAPVETFPVEQWDNIIALNLSAAFHTTRLVLPGMKAQGWGRIINIASVHGLVASANKSAYVAAKHGLVGFTKTVALELAQTGITCNALCPGWVLTPLVAKQITAKAQADGTDEATAQAGLLAEKQPSGEFVTPEQLGALAVFLCSPAANQVRGVAWNVDGGWAAQ